MFVLRDRRTVLLDGPDSFKTEPRVRIITSVGGHKCEEILHEFIMKASCSLTACEQNTPNAGLLQN